MQKEYTIQYKINVMAQALPSRITVAHTLLGLFGILLSLYLYFILSITFNIVERKAIATNIKEQTSQVSLLEADYTNRVRDVDAEFATSMGFTEPVKSSFAMRKTDAVVSFAR